MMNFNIFRGTLLIFAITLLLSCNQSKGKEYAPVATASSTHEIIVKEVLNSGGYSYLYVAEKNTEYWMAISKKNIKIGDKLYYKNSMEMIDFESKELNRTFDRILFVDRVNTSPKFDDINKKEVDSQANSKMQKLMDSIQIDPIEGSLSIGELYNKSGEYENKEVVVRGQVIKVNMNIMDRNWVHLMDGTKGDNRSDLTFTTQEIVKVGDTVVFHGILALDREFGAGYVYPLIVEKAVLK